MRLSTSNLTLAPDAAVDFQLHTTSSDGKWTPTDLIDHLVRESFALAAITDHDRVDTAAALQTLALEKGLPLLVAAEFTTRWRGDFTDVLCFGFDPENPSLQALTAGVLRRQQDNTREVFASLLQQGIVLDPPDALDTTLALPSAAQPPALIALVQQAMSASHAKSPDSIFTEFGITYATTDIATVVDAIHQSGGLALIAHPGRGQYYIPFTVERLDQLRAEVPIDGFEAYYPLHSAEQTAMFLGYAQQHNLLVSSGSDSHTPDRLPIPYPASNVRALLERLGIHVG